MKQVDRAEGERVEEAQGHSQEARSGMTKFHKIDTILLFFVRNHQNRTNFNHFFKISQKNLKFNRFRLFSNYRIHKPGRRTGKALEGAQGRQAESCRCSRCSRSQKARPPA